MNISENIKKLRQLYNLTQSELGKIAGVSDKAVWTWENGTAEPRMGAIQRIADYFHINKSDIIDSFNASSQLTMSEQSLIDLYRGLNDEGKYELMKQARLLNSVDIYKNELDISEELEA